VHTVDVPELGDEYTSKAHPEKRVVIRRVDVVYQLVTNDDGVDVTDPVGDSLVTCNLRLFGDEFELRPGPPEGPRPSILAAAHEHEHETS
jgi:hypothetical protein